MLSNLSRVCNPFAISLRFLSTTSTNNSVSHCKLLIAGGGTGGCATAYRLANEVGVENITVIEPADMHYYQPMWTLVGAGIKSIDQSGIPMKQILPKGINLLKTSVQRFDPDNNTVYTTDGNKITYDYLVVAMGLTLRYDLVPGLVDALENDDKVCSNYSQIYVKKTFPAFEKFREGNALFTFPNTPIKCAGAPQKIMYLFEEYLRQHKLREKANIEYFTSLGVIFGVKKYADELNKICHERNIHVNLKQHLVEVQHKKKIAIFENLDSKEKKSLQYDFLHVTPPMAPCPVIKESQLSDPATGYVAVDKGTLRHLKYPNVFALGDSASIPTSKTAAAIAAQSGVLHRNLRSVMKGESKLTAEYDGYTSCPLVTGYKKCILAEFDYAGQPLETLPLDQSKERYLSFIMKAHLMPQLYWHGLLKGYWNGPKIVRKIFHLGMGK